MFVFAIRDSIERGYTEFFVWIPKLFAALVILIIGYIIARVISGLITKALSRTGVDRTLAAQPAGAYIQRVTTSPSKLLGGIAFWAIFLAAVSLAVTELGINALEDLVSAVYAYLPNVLAALLIFVVAGAISAGVASLVTRLMGDTGLGKVVATVAPILVMTIATFMILDQLQIAEDIVRITYQGLIYAIALAAALAFGLGGRDVAREMLQGAYQKGQENKEQLGQDLQQGKERAKQEVDQQKARLEEGTSDTTSTGATTRVVRPDPTS